MARKALKIAVVICLLFSTQAVFALDVACDGINENDSPEILDAKYKKCQEEIKQHQQLIQQKENEAVGLQRDLKIIAAKVSKAQSEIKARDITILNTEREIDKKNDSIDTLETKIDNIISSTAELIRKTQDLESATLPEIILNDQDISDFLSDLSSFESIEASLKSTLDEIKNLKSSEEAAKKELSDKQESERSLKSIQEIEKRKLDLKQSEQSKILKETKGEETKYKAIVTEKTALVNKIRNMILKITGGGELTFEAALRLVRVAEDAIGIRAAFVLAILTQESGMDGAIGANQGKCYYNSPNGSYGTVMSNTQKPSYLALLAQLGKDPDKTPVSCPITSAGPYGGAMGPSQFMPKTWWDRDSQTGYKKRVEKVTGSVNASPFNNLDAFTATALYLSDALEGCEKIYSVKHNQEMCAAAKYYAGNNWKKQMNGYGAKVAARTDEFQKDIDVLDSQ